MTFLQDAVIYLTAAVFTVPLFKRLGLGTVLGYLAAGIIIGPDGLALIGDVHNVMHFAEFGVVLLLFLIGLELQPARLWSMRRQVFGVGIAQFLVTSLLLGGLGLLAGLSPTAAGLVGASLSLSSTAFALQMLAEKNQLTSPHGRSAFGILLFQDLAVIPLLAVLPLLGEVSSPSDGPLWVPILKVVVVLIGVGLGRLALRPVLRIVAKLHVPELLTATALLVVTGTALLVSSVGLSMALGAFLAGVLLADSEYRHELEADIEPFKGLLLGLFFIAVGMSVKLGVVAAAPLVVAGLVCGLVICKALVLAGLGQWALAHRSERLRLALIISQGGEFAFVLFGQGVELGILERSLQDLLVAVVSLSMVLTPFLLLLADRLQARWRSTTTAPAFDVAPSEDTPVIIAGFGRVGQIVGRVLRAKHIAFTALDSDPEHIDFVKQFGNKIFYGDASRLDLLRAARADKAHVFVLAIDQQEASLAAARMVLHHFPNLTIVARARNRVHAYALMNLGIKHVLRESFASSLEMSDDVLGVLGLPFSERRSAIERFRDHDERMVQAAYRYQDDPARLRELSRQARQELESLFAGDAAANHTAP